jgi:hypothetical protein
MHIERLWVASEDVELLLNNKDVGSVYRTSTEQYALIIDGVLVWRDVISKDYVNN